MNRADAIDLDDKSKAKECTKCLGINIHELEFEARKAKRLITAIESKEMQMQKGHFLMDVIKIAHQSGEIDLLKKASKRLLGIVNQI